MVVQYIRTYSATYSLNNFIFFRKFAYSTITLNSLASSQSSPLTISTYYCSFETWRNIFSMNLFSFLFLTSLYLDSTCIQSGSPETAAAEVFSKCWTPCYIGSRYIFTSNVLWLFIDVVPSESPCITSCYWKWKKKVLCVL